MEQFSAVRRRLRAQPDARSETRDSAFYRAGAVLAAAYVLFGVVLNYTANFTSYETSYFLLPMIHRRGLGFAWSDLWQSSVEVLAFDNGSAEEHHRTTEGFVLGD